MGTTIVKNRKLKVYRGPLPATKWVKKMGNLVACNVEGCSDKASILEGLYIKKVELKIPILSDPCSPVHELIMVKGLYLDLMLQIAVKLYCQI